MLHLIVQEAVGQGDGGGRWNAISTGMLTWFVIELHPVRRDRLSANVLPNIGLLGMYCWLRSGALKAAE